VIRGKSVDEVLAMTKRESEDYFMEYAGYMEDAPPASRYTIRMGLKIFRSYHTHELRRAFERYVSCLRANRARWR